MAVSAEQIETVLDLFADLGPLTTRKMMGGLCLYRDGTIFALLMSDGQPMLKAKGPVIERMEAMGSTRWTYSRDGKKKVAMPYWTLPDAALDDPDLACELARETLAQL